MSAGVPTAADRRARQAPQALQAAKQRGGSGQAGCVHALLSGGNCFCGCGEAAYGGGQGCHICCRLCRFGTTVNFSV